ncbi:MAG: creatininase family protein [Ectothiorhodospiraceae bacterium]|nr:creatininase family protein [Chromatiales bacterium]MCP5154360.1 creatininase family protein [Ectothiorhodospiraceae bacterium]
MSAASPAGVHLEDLAWPQAKAWIERGAPVVIPIGAAAKEHGHHLPLSTDRRVAEALARRVAEALPVLVAPVVHFGYYPAFRHYPGSQHLAPATFTALLTDIVEGFVGQGVRRLAIINTGVSTAPVIDVLAREIYERHAVRIAVADIARLGLTVRERFEQALGGHGDEQETSLMLAIAPHLVDMARAPTDYGNLLGRAATVFREPAIFGADPGSGIDYSATGIRGDASLASVEKGRVLLEAMVEDLVRGLRVTFFDDSGGDRR